MAHETFIEYKNQGFWIPESFIEILSHFLCLTYEQSGLNTYSENLLEIYSNCDANRSGINAGMVNILFDKYLTDDDINHISGLFDETKKLLISLGDQISIESLNVIENQKEDEYFKHSWVLPIQTKSLISTIDFMTQLLAQNFYFDNMEIHYTGFPKVNTKSITV